MALCTGIMRPSCSPLVALLFWLVLETMIVPRERFVGFFVQGQSTAELDLCATNLVAADVNRTDGYLSLYEYEDFVNERYYRNCPARVVVAESVAQWQAFTSLACLSCLEETLANSLTTGGGTLSALPDCCLPFNNSRIEIQSIKDNRGNGGSDSTIGSTASPANNENASMAWLQRICNDADAAAVADLCYTARPVTAAPATSTTMLAPPSAAPVLPLPAVIVPTPTSTSSTMAPSVTTVSTTNDDLSCVVDLMVADADTSGTLNRNEFTMFLQLHALSATAASIVASASSPRDNTTSSMIDTTSPTTSASSLQCIVPTDETVVTAAYATLVCASCLLSPTSGDQASIDLTCCTTSTTSTISTLGVQSPPSLRTPSEKDWITRLCVTATALLNCSSASTSNATPEATPAINGTNTTSLPLLPGNSSATNTSQLVSSAAVSNTTSANDTMTLSLNTTNGTITTNSSSTNTTSTAPVPSPAISNPNSTNGNTSFTLAPAATATSTQGTAAPVPAVADAAAAAATTTTAEAPRSSGGAARACRRTCLYGWCSTAVVSALTALFV